jgi:endo-1,4-beta-xylanase
VASLLLVVLAAACTAATSDGTADDDPVPETDGEEVAMLRDVAPEGLLVGSAVAGGGHHRDQSYPDPFTADDAYRDRLAAEFSSLTPENQLKWEFLRPSPDEFVFGPADAIVDFAEQHGQAVRGHALLWHNQNPDWLEQADLGADELRGLLRDHIATVVGRYAGRIHQWDVANEIFDDRGELRLEDNLWLRELGPDVVADAFRWAHEADPGAELFLNDYNAESINVKSSAYLDLIRELLADGVPVHGFGVQGHLGIQWGFPGDVEANLRRFDGLGIATAVTELDVRMVLGEGGEPTDEQLARQADDHRRLLEACLAVDGCRSFTVWGFPDRYSWVPHFFPEEGAATILWDDLAAKPAYEALHDTLSAARAKTGGP